MIEVGGCDDEVHVVIITQISAGCPAPDLVAADTKSEK